MSTTTQTVVKNFVPPAYETPHVMRQFEEMMAEVADVIAPVWPLQDYVAVNPYAGLSHRSFLGARSFLKMFSDCESLMPIEYYAAQFHRGKFTRSDIKSALTELELAGVSQALSASQIAENLMMIGPDGTSPDNSKVASQCDQPIRTVAAYATAQSQIDWTEAIVDEVSKHCSAHYDQGHSTWSSPYSHLPLYQAWRTVAEHDCNIEILGLSGFRKFVATLPHTPEAAIVHLLQQLNVPQALWSSFLLCQAFSMPGWSAWAKYQTSWAEDESVEKNDLTGLLAIRLAYDVALAEAESLSLNWNSLLENRSLSLTLPSSNAGDDSVLRYALLRASEIGFRNSLLESVSFSDDEKSVAHQRKLAQMVFCIDVRSERIRRQIESRSDDIETFGFAGFFAMAFEYVSIGATSGTSQLPVLLKPQFKLHEGLHEGDSPCEKRVIGYRDQIRSWRMLWRSFQTSAVGCFSFVESTGLFYGFKLLSRTVGFRGKSVKTKYDGLAQEDHNKLGPTLRGLNQQGMTTSRQADMAETMLRNLGLAKDFARLVVFCGHACQTENNPLAAGLDCGACGGHSGEPNARFAAMLLNQPYIREAMADRGIQIPADTYFLGALHNTTTDRIEWFDVDEVPAGHHEDLRTLVKHCNVASDKTRIERMPILVSDSLGDLMKRACDWSEVRPEWGLAGNAAFVVAPRSFTKQANLDARSFLHSYDYTQDAEGKVLETIMTAPMVVAHWINMQYYASTVDNDHFGSGNKTVHNVVGRFGILSGNGGDLKTGLPWQSLHTGDEYQHLPMRLQTVIAAPRESIDRVIAKHQVVADLLTGGWLHLIAIEDETFYRFAEDGTWEPVKQEQSASISGV